ncbi:hypothetical protein EKT70_09300, partial [Stenotrophomonas geniculata]
MRENALALCWGVFVYGVSGYPANGEAPRGGRGERLATEGWPGGGGGAGGRGAAARAGGPGRPQ